MSKATDYWRSSEGIRCQYRPGRGLDLDHGTEDIIRQHTTGRVCDIGCGTGRLVKLFRPDHYIGVDINNTALDIAIHTYPDYAFKKCEGWFPDADTYLLHTVALHIEDENLRDFLGRIPGPATGKLRTIMIIETFGLDLRSETDMAFNRDKTDYLDLIKPGIMKHGKNWLCMTTIGK